MKKIEIVVLVSFFYVLGYFSCVRVMAAEPLCTESCMSTTECGDVGGTVVAGKCSSGVCCDRPSGCYHSGTYYNNGSGYCSGGYKYTCNNGSWSSVRCNYGCSSGKCKVAPAVCGTANAQTFSAAPSTNLCTRGTGTTVKTVDTNSDGYNDSYTWNCNIDNGDDVSCAAIVSCASMTTNAGCPGAGTCQGMYQFGTIIAENSCGTTGGVCCKPTTCSRPNLCLSSSVCSAVDGVANNTTDCAASGNVCCSGDKFDDECQLGSSGDTLCAYRYGSTCYKCVDNIVSGVHINYECKNVPVEGVCSGSSGGQKCSWSQVTASCSSGSVSVTDSNGSDGYFNWICNGSCSGNSPTCSVRNLPTTNGVCNSLVNGANLVSKPNADDLCTSGEATWIDGTATDGTFNWTCSDPNNCGGSTATCSAIHDLAPTLTQVEMIGESGSSACPDGSGRNQICDFYNMGVGGTASTWNKIIQIKVTGADVNGLTDIKDMRLRFMPRSGGSSYTTGLVPANNGVVIFPIDTTSLNGTYDISVEINDAHSQVVNLGWIPLTQSTWVSSSTTCPSPGGSFKVWDCLVGVNGTFYDGSEAGSSISCAAGVGYSQTIPSTANFGLSYAFGTGSPRNMTVTSPTFTDGGNKLYWNSPVKYQSIFPNFPGSQPTQMRVTDTNNQINCVSGVTLDPKLADPYAPNPSLIVDYSSILDQDAWFRIFNGSVMSQNTVSNYVPPTCSGNQCKTADNGVIWQAKPSSNLSTYDQTDNKILGTKIDIGNHKYQFLKNRYYDALGIGTTVDHSTNWSDISSLTGIIFIQGDLTINENIEGSDFRYIIAQGNISIGTTLTDVTQINAILSASNIQTTPETNSDIPLTINGALYATNDITLNRSFITPSQNNTRAAVVINYDPKAIFSMPKELAKSVTQWKLN